MPLYQVVILAIVQGLSEFLPISSTAHLYLAPWLFGWQDPGLPFDIALHIGTLVAVLIYFFRDWVQVIGQGLGMSAGSDEELRKNRMLLWLLAAATIPVGIFGLAFNKQAETSWRNPWVIGTMLIFVAILMMLAEKVSARSRNLGQVNALDAAIIGCSQALAVIPGTSRSGITITTGLFRNLDRQAAARFSFLLSTPAIGAAAAKALYDLHKEGGLPPGAGTEFALGIVISGLVGWAVIAFFLKYLRNHSLTFFAWYRIIFGIIVIALAFSRR
ncbi:MAG TPA: undecaprenyl-diphosphatase UppP [Bryobacteraceae bacterium]|nr:undecaprenyl-diphosphatase UppP [Bryobacteraceae bacterium]